MEGVILSPFVSASAPQRAIFEITLATSILEHVIRMNSNEIALRESLRIYSIERLKNKFKYQPKKFTQQFNHSIYIRSRKDLNINDSALRKIVAILVSNKKNKFRRKKKETKFPPKQTKGKKKKKKKKKRKNFPFSSSEQFLLRTT